MAAAAAVQWLVDRFGLREFRDHVLYRRVPKDPWYQGDGEAMLLLFAIQLQREHTAARAMRLFSYSISYVTLLFGAMALDQLVR